MGAGVVSGYDDTATRAANQARREALFAGAGEGAVWSWEVEDAAVVQVAREHLVTVLGSVQAAWPDVVLVGDAVAQRQLLRALVAYRDARMREERRAATVSGVARTPATAGGVSRRGVPWWVIALVVLAVVMWFSLG